MNKNKSAARSAFFNPRILISFTLFLFALGLTLIAGGLSPGPTKQLNTNKGAQPGTQRPDTVRMLPTGHNLDLRLLPYVAPNDREEGVRFTRHPFPVAETAKTGKTAAGPTIADRIITETLAAVTIPNPIQTFAGMGVGDACIGCFPPDTDGDVGPNHYIQSVNSSIRIHDKSGNVLAGPITYNSFFFPLGTSTPCGNALNDGDGIVFYDHISDRWVVSDFAFQGSPGSAFYQCIGVSKTGDPVSGGWYLYAIQVDPANPGFLGDYPKFGLWPDAYYLTVNLFADPFTFSGVRVFALDRKAM